VFVRSVKATEFLDANGQPVLQSSLIPNWAGSGYRLRLLPGVYYFARIALQNNNVVEIANDSYMANGQTPLWDANHLPINGPATTADYDSMGNRITLFVDAITNYQDSIFGSGLFTALRGDQSASNPLRYRRPGNFRIYAK